VGGWWVVLYGIGGVVAWRLMIWLFGLGGVWYVLVVMLFGGGWWVVLSAGCIDVWVGFGGCMLWVVS